MQSWLFNYQNCIIESAIITSSFASLPLFTPSLGVYGLAAEPLQSAAPPLSGEDCCFHSSVCLPLLSFKCAVSAPGLTTPEEKEKSQPVGQHTRRWAARWTRSIIFFSSQLLSNILLPSCGMFPKSKQAPSPRLWFLYIWHWKKKIYIYIRFIQLLDILNALLIWNCWARFDGNVKSFQCLGLNLKT